MESLIVFGVFHTRLSHTDVGICLEPICVEYRKQLLGGKSVHFLFPYSTFTLITYFLIFLPPSLRFFNSNFLPFLCI